MHVTKWLERISQERFDLETPNFIQTYTSTSNRIVLEMTSQPASCRKFPRKKTRENAGSDDLEVNFSERLLLRIAKLYSVTADNLAQRFLIWPHNRRENKLTSYETGSALQHATDSPTARKGKVVGATFNWSNILRAALISSPLLLIPPPPRKKDIYQLRLGWPTCAPGWVKTLVGQHCRLADL